MNRPIVGQWYCSPHLEERKRGTLRIVMLPNPSLPRFRPWDNPPAQRELEDALGGQAAGAVEQAAARLTNENFRSAVVHCVDQQRPQTESF
jgi:hypothetical protein